MKFHILAVLSREPTDQSFQNRFLVDAVIEVKQIDQLNSEITRWLGMTLREEPMSTKLISFSHTKL